MERNENLALNIVDIHDRIMDAYYGKMGDDFMRKTQRRIHWVCEQARGRNILDVGCSQGIVPILLGREGKQVLGIDSDPNAIKVATQYLQLESGYVQGNVNFVTADFAAIDLHDRTFDSVIMSEVLEHLIDPAFFIETASNLLTEGGRLIITVPFGINDFVDHKRTYYFAEPYRLLSRWFDVGDVRIFGRWIGFVGTRRTEPIESGAAATVDAALIEQIEAAFYTMEREIRDTLVQANTRLEGANKQCRVLSEQINGLKEKVAEEARQREAANTRFQGTQQQIDDATKQLATERAAFSRREEMLRRDLDVKIQAAHELELSLVRTDATVASISVQLDALKEERNELLRANADKAEHMLKLELAVQTKSEQAEVLQCQLSDALDSLDRERAQSQNKISELQKQLDSANAALDREKNTRSECEAALTSSKRAIQILTQEKDRFASERSTQHAKIAQLQVQFVEAQAKRDGHYRHLQAERKKSERLAKQVALLENDNRRMSGSLSLAVGSAIVKTKTLRDSLYLPGKLIAVFKRHKEKKRRKELERRENEQRVISLPQSPSASFDDTPKLLLTDREAPTTEKIEVSQETCIKNAATIGLEVLVRGWPVPEQGKLRVMSVLDEFSRECFSPHAALIEPRPDNWRPLLDRDSPQLLFVESAWRGNRSTWQYRVAKYANAPGGELREMVSEFRSRGLPTVFWNKEDPVHFDNFIESATEFDYVFTTAEEAISKYQQRTKAKIHVLPFAAEPHLHNPIGAARRNGRVCFAGSFYANRFVDRRNDQLMLLDAASNFDLDIYDRNYNMGQSSHFCFPERFAPRVKGSLSYSEMGDAYRKYSVFLNVNSVVNSKSMFSRRVFELLACGTPVVSTTSLGIEETFGNDLVWIVNNENEAVEAINTLLSSTDEWRRRSLQGIRTVFQSHTFTHRFQTILNVVGVPLALVKKTKVAAFAEVRTFEDVSSAVEFLSRQKRESFVLEPVLIIRGSVSVSDLPIEVSIVRTDRPVSSVVEDYAQESCADYIWIVNHSCGYGANFLEDLVISAGYSSAQLVGKPLDGIDAYSFEDQIDVRACIFRTDVFKAAHFQSSSIDSETLVDEVSRTGGRIFASDGANFIRNLQGASLLEKLDLIKKVEL